MKVEAISSILLLLLFWGCSSKNESNLRESSQTLEELDSINGIAFKLLDINLDSCMELSKRNIIACEQNAYDSGLAVALAIQGCAYTAQSFYDSAIKIQRRALDLRKSSNDLLSVGKSYNNISDVYRGMGDHQTALRFADSAYQIFDSLGSYSLMSGAASNKAIDYIMMDQVDSAEYWFQVDMRLAKVSGNRTRLWNSYYNYGIFLNSNGNLDSSLRYILQAIQIVREDSLFAAIPGMYMSHGQRIKDEYPQQALALYDTALTLAKEHGLTSLEEKVLGSRISLLKELNVKVDSIIPIYDSLVDKIRDNHNQGRTKDFADFEVKYKTAEKEVKLRETKADLQHQKVTKRWLMASFVLVVLVLTLLMLSTVQKRKLAVRDRELSEKRIDALIKNQEMKKIDDLLEFQEKERGRIASDLHDRLGSILSAVKLNFSSMEEKLNRQETKSDNQYKVVKELIDNAATEVRRIAHDMASGVLAKFGLVHAVYDLKKVLEASGKIKIDVFEHGMDERLSSNTEISLYRIIQELVSNTLKHAKATTIDIHFTRTDDVLTVIVEDDGSGFVKPDKPKKGIGLRNIDKRVSELNGNFTIDSNPKSGTTAIIEIIL